MPEGGFWGWMDRLTDDLLKWRTLVVIGVILGLALGWFQWTDIRDALHDLFTAIAPHL